MLTQKNQNPSLLLMIRFLRKVYVKPQQDSAKANIKFVPMFLRTANF